MDLRKVKFTEIVFLHIISLLLQSEPIELANFDHLYLKVTLNFDKRLTVSNS